MIQPNRRDLLKSGIAATLSTFVPTTFFSGVSAYADEQKKLPVAAIVTEYRFNGHSDVILGKILEGFQQDGGKGPDLKLVSIYTDQVPDVDMSRSLSEKYGFKIVKTIDEAITLGTNQIQVAGVISIGEHGDYPLTPDTKQQMYPRRRFFDEIVAAFRRCGKAVPVFNDKHIGYRWDDAKYMVDTARAMKFPFMAGSSLPVAWRYPVLELPIDCEMEEALVIAYGGFERYGFHALETLQCMIERRKGGETGVKSVQAVTLDGVRQAENQGLWSRELYSAALKTLPGPPKESDDWMKNPESGAFLMQHNDGLKSAVLMANGLVAGFAFAAKLKGQREPVTTQFKLQDGVPHGHFGYLVQAIDQMIHTGKAPYPIERTLLTTGVLDRVMQSLSQEGKLFQTPELNVTYAGSGWPFANHPKATMALPNN